MKAEYQGNEGFLQRDSVEHKGYAEVQSTDRRERKERDDASSLLEAILDRNNLLHKQIRDMRVLCLIKKYLKSGVMENGVICKTEEGSPQGGPLSPLLANIYLNEFDWEMYGRGVKLVRYADDIVVLPRTNAQQNACWEPAGSIWKAS